MSFIKKIKTLLLGKSKTAVQLTEANTHAEKKAVEQVIPKPTAYRETLDGFPYCIGCGHKMSLQSRGAVPNKLNTALPCDMLICPKCSYACIWIVRPNPSWKPGKNNEESKIMVDVYWTNVLEKKQVNDRLAKLDALQREERKVYDEYMIRQDKVAREKASKLPN
jgi:hypothetical protein